MIDRESPWRRSGVMFGRMFEDWDVEANVFPDRSNVFCIASAGCTALGLASLGHDVTAVDINPAQVALVRARLTGADAPAGSVDRMLARARRIGGALGWSEATLGAFLSLTDTAGAARDRGRTCCTARRRGGPAELRRAGERGGGCVGAPRSCAPLGSNPDRGQPPSWNSPPPPAYIYHEPRGTWRAGGCAVRRK